MNLLTPFSLSDQKTKFLQEGDLEPLQLFLARNADFSELITGLPPNSSDAQNLLEEAPEGKTATDKTLIGIYSSSGNLIGVLDAVQNHPESGDWWLGLLLIDPSCRGKGLGRNIYLAFEEWISQAGATNIYLGVVEANHRAFSFWQRMGFVMIKRRPPRKFGNLDQVVIVMKKEIKKV